MTHTYISIYIYIPRLIAIPTYSLKLILHLSILPGTPLSFIYLFEATHGRHSPYWLAGLLGLSLYGSINGEFPMISSP